MGQFPANQIFHLMMLGRRRAGPIWVDARQDNFGVFE
jgi:hypothetical protein